MTKRNDELDIKDLVELFLPKLWIIIIFAVILGIALGGYAMFFKADTYTSRATFMLSRDNSTTISSSDIELSYRVIENMEIVIFSLDFLEDMAEHINDEYSHKNWNVKSGELKRAISLSMQGETSAFVLSVTTGDAELSLAIAESLVHYLLPTDDGDAPIKEFLPNAYSKISIKRTESPRKAISKNDKGIVTNAIIGVMLGALGSMVVIYLFAMFDIVIHDKKKLEDSFDIPILGVIPKYEVGEDVQAKEGAEQ